jgi:hypothetical protein
MRNEKRSSIFFIQQDFQLVRRLLEKKTNVTEKSETTLLSMVDLTTACLLVLFQAFWISSVERLFA